MPRNFRYFPVNHDINADPEVWELTDRFGDRALRIWLEILSIADRNKGELPGPWEKYPSVLAARCKSTTRHLVTVCQWVTRWLVIDSQGVARVRNYAKYHRTRGENRDSPNLPILSSSYKNKKEDNTSPLTRRWPDPYLLIEKYNQETCEDLPAVEKITPARLKKARYYLQLFPEETFWSEVFRQVNASSFLRGKQSQNGHTSFRGDFDWLLTKGKDGTENVAKVWEGKYG